MTIWVDTTEKNIQHINLFRKSGFDMLRRFIDVNGFNKMTPLRGDGTNIPTIIRHGKQSPRYNPVRDKDFAPFQDHSMFYKNTKSGICCLTYAPYYNAEVIRKEIEKWAEKWKLKADVYDADKCWYSENTCFVVIRLPTNNVIIP